MSISRLIELLPYNAAHRRRLEIAVHRRLASGMPWYAAFEASGLVTTEKLADALAALYKLPRYDGHFRQSVNSELRDLMPASIARTHSIAPVFRFLGRLTLAVVDPTQVEAFDVVARNTGFQLRLTVATAHVISGLLDALYGLVSIVADDDRRWRIGALDSGGTSARKAGRYVNVDMLKGYQMQPTSRHRLDGEHAECGAETELHVVERGEENIENIYTLEAMPSLSPEK